MKAVTSFFRSRIYYTMTVHYTHYYKNDPLEVVIWTWNKSNKIQKYHQDKVSMYDPNPCGIATILILSYKQASKTKGIFRQQY